MGPAGVKNSMERGLGRAAHLTYATAKAYRRLRATLRYRNALRGGQDPLVIFQMGKVGSTTIQDSLHAWGGASAIFHIHTLSDTRLRWLDARLRAAFPITRSVPMHFIESLLLRSHVQHRRAGRRWKIVTLVREPVARNISAFFQNIELEYPEFNFAQRLIDTEPAVLAEQLMPMFLEQHDDHTRPGEWFDHEMRPAFGVDVFEAPFSHETGYARYRSNRADTLLIRLEDLDRCAGEAFARFLDIDTFTLVPGNITLAKNYADVYDCFKRTIPLPATYLDTMYSSRFAEHFYSDVDRATLRRKWTRA